MIDHLDIGAEQHAEAERQRRARKDRQLEDQDYAWLMSGPRGRRIVARLIEQCGTVATSFNTNALAMAHNEGARSIGVHIHRLLERVCPKELVAMVGERSEEQKA